MSTITIKRALHTKSEITECKKKFYKNMYDFHPKNETENLEDKAIGDENENDAGADIIPNAKNLE